MCSENRLINTVYQINYSKKVASVVKNYDGPYYTRDYIIPFEETDVQTQIDEIWDEISELQQVSDSWSIQNHNTLTLFSDIIRSVNIPFLTVNNFTNTNVQRSITALSNINLLIAPKTLNSQPILKPISSFVYDVGNITYFSYTNIKNLTNSLPNKTIIGNFNLQISGLSIPCDYGTLEILNQVGNINI
jgi:hypothetical protein